MKISYYFGQNFFSSEWKSSRLINQLQYQTVFKTFHPEPENFWPKWKFSLLVKIAPVQGEKVQDWWTNYLSNSFQKFSASLTAMQSLATKKRVFFSRGTEIRGKTWCVFYPNRGNVPMSFRQITKKVMCCEYGPRSITRNLNQNRNEMHRKLRQKSLKSVMMSPDSIIISTGQHLGKVFDCWTFLSFGLPCLRHAIALSKNRLT